MADVGAFGAKEGGTDSVCIIVGPNGQGLNAGYVLQNGEGSEAGARGAGALEINGVNGPQAVLGDVSDKALEEVQGVLKGEKWCGFVFGSFVASKGFNSAAGDLVTG